MTAIDPHADLELDATDRDLVARLPLASMVDGEWMRRYDDLARAIDAPAVARANGDRAWIAVAIPIDSSQEQAARRLDAARALIGDADEANARADHSIAATSTAGGRPATPATNGVREWWAGTRPESHWPMGITIAAAAGIELALPSRFSLGGRWIVPAVQGVLLIALVVVDRVRFAHRVATARAITLAIVVVLGADAAGVTARLIGDLVTGGPETNSACALLSVGFGVWIYTIIAFTFAYWICDGGGATARTLAPHAVPDLAFPQHLNPAVRANGWRPTFLDYLYLGFTNATAFSPTDVMPLARWAKFAMALQAVISLAILGLVIARAVNILK